MFSNGNLNFLLSVSEERNTNILFILLLHGVYSIVCYGFSIINNDASESEISKIMLLLSSSNILTQQIVHDKPLNLGSVYSFSYVFFISSSTM